MSSWDGFDEFIAVASASSFTVGARAMGVSTTHVSRAVRALEVRLQTQLLNRTTRKVSLTDAGRIFLDHCLRIVQERDEAMGLINQQREPQGELRVTCATAIGERYVSPILRRFAMRHPKLSVTIDLSNRIVDLLGEGFDLGIRTGHHADTRFMATQVASRSLWTCAAPAYLNRAGLPRTLEDLRSHECIIGTNSTWRFRAEGQETIFRPTGRFRCNSGHAVIEACVAGMGICQLPDFYVLPYLQHGMVEVILPDLQPDDEPIFAVYPQGRYLQPKVQSAVDCLQQELASAMHVPRKERRRDTRNQSSAKENGAAVSR